MALAAGRAGRARRRPRRRAPRRAGLRQGSLNDDPQGPGYTDTGLSGVDLKDQAPLAAPGSVAAVAKALLPSTVQILAEYDGQEAGATGSGWVMDGDGHIVTNNHVVAEAAKDNGPIVVIDHDRNRYDAEVVGRRPVYDLAILYVKKHDKVDPGEGSDGPRRSRSASPWSRSAPR
ncbi:serine protease [Nocardioides sp. W3-2-3]|nr:serine protease [Nocardioides convexus]